MGSDGETRQQASRDPGDEHFQRLAKIADAMARMAEASADLYDEMAGHMPAAAENAAARRLFAAAEKEAAEAFRHHRMPPPAVRQAIRVSGSGVDAQADVDQRAIDMEEHDSEMRLGAMALAAQERWLEDREGYRSDRRDERDQRADARDEAADDRDKQADERDRRADARDAGLTERNMEADEREHTADQREIDFETDRTRPSR
jgi:sulfite oxidase